MQFLIWNQDSIKNTLSAIAKVIRSSQGDGWDGVLLATALPQSTTPKLQLTFDEWEDTCREHGFEYVDSEATGRNEFGGKSIVNNFSEISKC